MPTIRVVLADDHAVVRAGIANTLKELPDMAVVGEVGDGLALHGLLARVQPDLLLTDVTMPHFEPLATIGEIRARYPALKILVVSAYDDNVYVQGLLAAGVHGYHLKDQPLSDLRLAVQRVLAGERWICAPLLDKLIHGREAPQPAVPLTARQRDLLRCLMQGQDNQAIARTTGLSVKTVENHLTRIYKQLGVQSRLEAVHFISQHPELLGDDGGPNISGAGLPASAPQFTMLLVDDSLRYRTQLRRMISKAYPNALLYEAENTRQALDCAAETRPRLALVDVVLGDEHGIECVRQLKACSPTTRILLFSAYPDREFHRLGLQAGAVAFLDKKDLSAVALREVIDDMVG